MKEVRENRYFIPKEIPEEMKPAPNTLFQDYSILWLEENKNRLKPKTAERYGSLLERINCGIGHIELNEIKSYHIKAFNNRLSLDGANKRTGKGLSEKTILHHHKLISLILKQAVRDSIIDTNPADINHMNPPKPEKKEVKYLTEDETIKLINILNNERIKWRTATLILLSTGMRRGELMGLEWRDIDFKNRIIQIKRTSQYTVEKGIFTTGTKSRASQRVFKITEIEMEFIKYYRDWWEKEKLQKLWGRTDRLFVKKDGKPMHPDSVTDWLRKLCKKHDIPHFSPHSLRHTNVSLLIAAGVPIKKVAERVGHAQTSTTMNIYAHQIKYADELATDAVESIFNLL